MSEDDNKNFCEETPPAPEWLQKLENRCEQLCRSKLGHEAGAGASCNVCGNSCPGLDLHFWRKVCRNCKCRKDQHKCPEDDLGWAQFEMLGQIRSKPAYIRIKTMANRRVQVEWVPPNVAPDVVSDYMEKLGAAIPMIGSDAADRRKQQLAFQVPPHDLDASFCDNLSELESSNLQKYVDKIRMNCVGQGNVVRIGDKDCVSIEFLTKEDKSEWCGQPSRVSTESVLDGLLSSEYTINALTRENEELFANFAEITSAKLNANIELESMLCSSIKKDLSGINKNEIRSLVQSGTVYDKILTFLKNNHLDISQYPNLGAIADFRRHPDNPEFRRKIHAMCSAKSSNSNKLGIPSKTGEVSLPNNLSASLKNPVNIRSDTQMCQRALLKGLKFDDVSIIHECELPINVQYEKDPLFAQIIFSEPLRNAIQTIHAGRPPDPLIISLTPLVSDLNESTLSTRVKQQLQTLRVDLKVLQSCVINGAFYDKLFKKMDKEAIPYNVCNLLLPIKHLRHELLVNSTLREEIKKFVVDQPNSSDVAYNYSFIPDSSCEYSEPAALTSDFQNLHLTHKNKNWKGPISSLRCRDCEQLITFGEVAVKAQRAGEGIAWHPECFKCYTCHQLLADLVYFYYSGEVYCGRDLAIKLNIPRCKACDELIFTKEYTAAEGATFHIKHFCCFNCDTPLAGQQYIPDEKTNMPLCLQCYREHFAAFCQYCARAIGPSEQGIVWQDIHWHTACFVCSDPKCGKSLVGGRFCVKQNLPFCSHACVESIK